MFAKLWQRIQCWRTGHDYGESVPGRLYVTDWAGKREGDGIRVQVTYCRRCERRMGFRDPLTGAWYVHPRQWFDERFDGDDPQHRDIELSSPSIP